MHSVLLYIVRDDVVSMMTKAVADAVIATKLETTQEVTREVARDTERSTTASNIKNVMKSLGLSLEEAMDAMCIPSEEREDYAALVATQ